MIYSGSSHSTNNKQNQPNTYRLIWYDAPASSALYPKVVTLTSRNPLWSLPSPDLLQAHFSIAKILYVSDIGRKSELLCMMRRWMEKPYVHSFGRFNGFGFDDLSSIADRSVGHDARWA